MLETALEREVRIKFRTARLKKRSITSVTTEDESRSRTRIQKLLILFEIPKVNPHHHNRTASQPSTPGCNTVGPLDTAACGYTLAGSGGEACRRAGQTRDSV